MSRVLLAAQHSPTCISARGPGPRSPCPGRRSYSRARRRIGCRGARCRPSEALLEPQAPGHTERWPRVYRPVGRTALPVCAGPPASRAAEPEVGEGRKRRRLRRLQPRPGSERRATWSGRRGSAGCGRCCSTPAAAAWLRPRVSTVPGRGGGNRGTRGPPGRLGPRAAAGVGGRGPLQAIRGRGGGRLPRPARAWGTRGDRAFPDPGRRGAAGGGRGGEADLSPHFPWPSGSAEPGARAWEAKGVRGVGGGSVARGPERMRAGSPRGRRPRSVRVTRRGSLRGGSSEVAAVGNL